ncbi:CMP-N-acetylneuraminic acid synthetase [Candidatus Magnetobacterium bavaricum]|uniref:CMP-N-acetylneuraminic acid synthetase n=1 Tax=Candidatus Magnetobacterium bavaricum TaxID=29290 RepID=A0A0F3GHQ4_9BACT|nr:CMP-N-acetylneuraminic acid synthetase [Candidatus Magnetobacterium bavaricum]
MIHARGGSKRIPLKNIRLLGGKPLIAYMIRAALGSKHLQRVIVSTDHPDISNVARQYGAEVPFVRPPHLSEDCPSEWVTQHAVEFVEQEESSCIDIVVSMQPTTPFCVSEDIDSCVSLLLDNTELHSAFTAKIIHERPEWMFLLKDNKQVELFMEGELKGERGIIQSLSPMIVPNGAVYATKRNILFNEGLVIGKKSAVHIMPLERSVDIDEPIDLLFAEFLIEKGDLYR